MPRISDPAFFPTELLIMFNARFELALADRLCDIRVYRQINPFIEVFIFERITFLDSHYISSQQKKQRQFDKCFHGPLFLMAKEIASFSLLRSAVKNSIPRSRSATVEQ